MNWNEQDCEEQPGYSEETMGGVIKAWEREKAKVEELAAENKQLRLELHFPLVGDASSRIVELEQQVAALTAERDRLRELVEVANEWRAAAVTLRGRETILSDLCADLMLNCAVQLEAALTAKGET